jgi:hypothetical protein
VKEGIKVTTESSPIKLKKEEETKDNPEKEEEAISLERVPFQSH